MIKHLLFTLLIMIFFGKANAQLKAGDKVPSFQLQDQNGQTFDINSVLGKQPLIIYFYPKDETGGCTKEACSFRDSYEEFTQRGAKVIGISGDDVASHKSFAEHHKLPFTLLADKGNKVRKLFGVPRTFFIPGRVTYVVDRQGVVTYVFNNLTDGPKHVTEALEALKVM